PRRLGGRRRGGPEKSYTPTPRPGPERSPTPWPLRVLHVDPAPLLGGLLDGGEDLLRADAVVEGRGDAAAGGDVLDEVVHRVLAVLEHQLARDVERGPGVAFPHGAAERCLDGVADGILVDDRAIRPVDLGALVVGAGGRVARGEEEALRAAVEAGEPGRFVVDVDRRHLGRRRGGAERVADRRHSYAGRHQRALLAERREAAGDASDLIPQPPADQVDGVDADVAERPGPGRGAVEAPDAREA